MSLRVQVRLPLASHQQQRNSAIITKWLLYIAVAAIAVKLELLRHYLIPTCCTHELPACCPPYIYSIIVQTLAGSARRISRMMYG